MNEVTICNFALVKLGVHPISSLTDTTKEAGACNRFYENVRDAVLSEHPWGFASKRDTLALLTETYSGYDYAYAYPSDCITALKIYNASGADSGTYFNVDADSYSTYGRIEFKLGVNDALDQRIILTNAESAELIYTARVKNANLFDMMFIEALASKLAAELSLPLKGDSRMQQLFAQEYLYKLGQAKVKSSNEGYQKQVVRSAFTDARL